MKKTILFALIGLFIGINSNAQVSNQGPLDYSFGGVYKNAKGEKISKQDLQNYLSSYEYADYLNASRKFKNGVILTGVGVGCFATTAIILNGFVREGESYKRKYGDDYVPREDDHYDDDTINVLAGGFYGGMLSVVLLGGGLVCTAIGLPKMFIANGKLNGIAKEYNSTLNTSLSFGYQQCGVGLALHF